MMTVEDILKLNCTGCLACGSICPQNAISCVSDEEGFYVPMIDCNKCIDCGKCYRKCPANIHCYHDVPEKSYIAQLKDEMLAKDSASGGAFIGIAKYFMDVYGGVVVGAAVEKDLVVKHCVVLDDKGLKRLQNSKYVQSYTNEIYTQVKKLLDSGTFVLFSGTPCQIAGLYSVLSKEEKKRVFTIDLVCHGVPSPAFLKKHLEDASQSWQKRVVDYKFRIKKKRSKSKSSYLMMMMMMMGPPIVRLARKDVYFNLFMNSVDFRESCYSCKYSDVRRVADFTIGDCDSSEHYPEFYPEYSNSIILLNSPKAKNMWNQGLKELFHSKELDLMREAEHNHQLKNASDRPKERDVIYHQVFADDWKVKQFNYCEKESRVDRFKLLMLLHLPQSLIQKIGRSKKNEAGRNRQK